MTHPLAHVARLLSCPVCTGDLTVVELRSDGVPAVLGCVARHRFDVARQGYVALLNGVGRSLQSDTAAMVSARGRVLVHTGNRQAAQAGADTTADTAPFARLRTRIAGSVSAVTPADAVLLDVGSGTGQYTATCLDLLPSAIGIGIDLSKACARSTARAHPRLAGVVADAWSRLPLADASVHTAISIFSPRNVAEFARVLRADGRLVVAAPESEHLHELIAPMGMLRVGDDKFDALRAATHDVFEVESSEVVTYQTAASAQIVADLVGMGPSAFHATADEIASRAAQLVGAATVPVTVAVRVSVLRPYNTAR